MVLKVLLTGIPNPNGRFALSTIYYAKVVLTPKPGYSLPVASTDIGTPTVSGVSAFYNPETRTLTTANFPRTDPKLPPLPLGQFFKLTTWLASTPNPIASGWWDARPIQFNADGSALTVDDTTKAVTVPATSRGNAWDGFDIYIGAESDKCLDVDPSIYKVELTVKGKVLSTGTAIPKFDFVVEESGGSYTKVIEKKDLSLPAEGDLTFNYTAEIPEKFDPAKHVRIHPSIAGVGFVLEEVIFDNKGAR